MPSDGSSEGLVKCCHHPLPLLTLLPEVSWLFVDFLHLTWGLSVLWDDFLCFITCRSLIVFSTKYLLDSVASSSTWKLTLLNFGVYFLFTHYLKFGIFFVSWLCYWPDERFSWLALIYFVRWELFFSPLCTFLEFERRDLDLSCWIWGVEYLINTLFIIIMIISHICLVFYVIWKHFKLIGFFNIHKKIYLCYFLKN